MNAHLARYAAPSTLSPDGVQWAATSSRSGMTLVELLVTMVVISILSSLSLAGLAVARTSAKKAKTAATIRKISEIILPYYEEYETRRPAIDPTELTNLKTLVEFRTLYGDLKKTAVRRLMTMELPDRTVDVNAALSGWSGILHGTRVIDRGASSVNVTLKEISPTARRYRSLISGKPSVDSGELLHLIVTRGPVADPDVISHFRDDEVADTDGDGLLEFVDGWRKTILFKRWPTGFLSPMQPIDGTLRNIETSLFADGHRLVPLIYSAGVDGSYSIIEDIAAVNFSTNGYNPFDYDRRNDRSGVLDANHPASSAEPGSVVLVPVRRSGSAPVTYVGCRVGSDRGFTVPQLDAGCTPKPDSRFMTFGCPTGSAAVDNIHNHDMTR
jgi:prepilin-type N-terminal cleavage/methylation domain-containing protein